MRSQLETHCSLLLDIRKLARGAAMSQDSDYHRRQAAALIRLAQTTRDQETSVALMRLAAEHTELAEKSVRTGVYPRPTKN